MFVFFGSFSRDPGERDFGSPLLRGWSGEEEEGGPLCVRCLESELRTGDKVSRILGWEGDDGLPPQRRHGITPNRCVT